MEFGVFVFGLRVQGLILGFRVWGLRFRGWVLWSKFAV